MRILTLRAAACLLAIGTLPPAAVVAWLLLGAVAGGLAGVWTWLTTDPPRSLPSTTVRVGTLAAAGGLVLGALAATFGAAVVVALAALGACALVAAGRATIGRAPSLDG